LATRSAREVRDEDQRANGDCPQCEACPERDVLPAASQVARRLWFGIDDFFCRNSPLNINFPQALMWRG
jgi:hypothetical protein